MTSGRARTPAGADPVAAISSLRGLLEVTRVVRSDEELPRVLDQIAATMAEALGLGAVVINLYRPAWDDLEVASVHGSAEARELLLGTTNGWDVWRPLLDPRFERRGAFHVRAGEYDWSARMPRFVPASAGDRSDPGAWDPEDGLFVPFRGPDGEVLGIFSVDEPRSNRRPSDEEIDVLVALAEHAALAVQAAQEAVEASRHRAALERLLGVSGRLTQADSTASLLQAVCDGIVTALGFQRVAILLATDDGRLVPSAFAGWDEDDRALRAPFTVDGFAPALDARFEVEGCFLAAAEEVVPHVPSSHHAYRSVMNGRGPRAWSHHWLTVPLQSRDGTLGGVIWADDPADRLLPTRDRLQALRLFADQATAALASSAQLAEMTFLAEHDPHTRLTNRRAFMRHLGELGAMPGARFALAFCDVDGFKEVNDEHGHAAGDAALEALAAVLRGLLRRGDGAYRIGGDEFALLLRDAGTADAGRVVTRVNATLAASIDQRLARLRASFGVAVFPDHGSTADELFSRADKAMYEAKRSGARVRFAA